MLAALKNIPEAWRKAWASKPFRNHLALSLLALIGVMAYQFHYLRVWESRLGVPVNDFIQNFLPPIDFSIPIFVLEYSSLLLVFIYALTEPERLVKGLQMFAIVMLARTVTIYFVPLEPPQDMIFLKDPIASFFLHTETVQVTKDLFFSGHVSAITLLALLAGNRYLKYYVVFSLVAVSVMIVWQHVHYSMDVAFAAVFSYGTFRFVEWWHAQTKYGLQLQDA